MMALFLFIFYTIYYINSFHKIHSTVHSSVVIRRGSFPSPHCWPAQWEKTPWGAEPRIELGPALQRAATLPTDLRCTLKLL
jgi:hypothetical protein